MKQKLNLFIAYPAIKLTQKENTFLDTTVHKENDSKKKLFTILRHITSQLKPSNTLILALVFIKETWNAVCIENNLLLFK